jgi:preprotein translocase subunit SecG
MTINLINILLIISSALTMFLVVLNQPESSQTFGGKESFGRTRRGFEKSIHNLTVYAAAAVVVRAFLAQVAV